MQPYATDTSDDALAVQLEGFRRMSPTERVSKMCKLSASLRRMAMDAIRRKSCFNLIHLPTSFKVDAFVSRQRPFDLQTISHAQTGTLGLEKTLAVPIATAEDVIIIKLEWFRLGGETSERQWDDVSRLMTLLGDTADLVHLQQASESVGVEDLLLRLLG